MKDKKILLLKKKYQKKNDVIEIELSKDDMDIGLLVFKLCLITDDFYNFGNTNIDLLKEITKLNIFVGKLNNGYAITGIYQDKHFIIFKDSLNESINSNEKYNLMKNGYDLATITDINIKLSLDEYLDYLKKNKIEIIIGGFGYGGCLANLCADELLNNDCKINLITFGSPDNFNLKDKLKSDNLIQRWLIFDEYSEYNEDTIVIKKDGEVRKFINSTKTNISFEYYELNYYKEILFKYLKL